MKMVISIASSFLLSSSAFSQQSVKVNSLVNYVGDSISICGKIVSVGQYLLESKDGEKFVYVRDSSSSKHVRLTLSNALNIDIEEFKNSYKQKNICVNGRIYLKDNQPYIVIYNQKQLEAK